MKSASQNRDKVLRSRAQQVSVCLCKKDVQLEYLTASQECSEDFAAVSALPEQWITLRSGPILSSYLQEREKSHANVMEDLLKESRIVNDEINNKVKTLAQFLLEEIKHNQRDINCVVDKCSLSEKLLSTDDRTKALTQINILLSQRIQRLTNFKLEALALERDRATALKTKLRLYFQKLISIGHRTPKDLLHEFDKNIYDINQQLMSNCRENMLLEIKLRYQADESLVRARSTLNQMSFVIPFLRRGRSALPWSKEQTYLRRSTSATGNREINITDPQDLTHQFSDINSQNKLVEGYRDAVYKMFMGISGQLDELYKDIGEHNIIVRDCGTPAITAVQKIIEKANQSMGLIVVSNKDLHRGFIEISSNCISNMQRSLSTFGDNLKDTYLMLHCAGHLWDSHMLRLALAQKLTMATVEDLIVSNDAIQLANEVLTNIAIEQLRLAPDTDKLQHYLDFIVAAFDRTADLYKQQSETEIGRLEEFTNLNSSLTNTLLAECANFLECNPKSELPEIKNASNTPIGNALTSARLLVLKAILQTEIQNVALRNWRNGFLETFEINMSIVPDQLSQQTQLWVDERIDILRIRHSTKLMTHSVRKERIQAAFEMRVAELRLHEDRLNSHLDAIYNLVNNMPSEASEFISLDSAELYPLCWWLSRIQDNINELFARDPLDPEIKRLKMLSYASRLIKHRQLFSESLEVAIEQYKKSIEYRVQVARIANVRFISQLKLFNEGGKYSAGEALKTCMALVRGADALELCISRTIDCVNHRRSQLLILADQQIAPIQKIVDEVLKNQKGFLEKKKHGTAKK